MRRLVAVLLLVAALGTMPARAQDGRPSTGSVSIRLLDAPSERQEDPRAQIYIVDHLHQGDRIQRRIEIGNTTPGPMDVKLYPGAASVRDGKFQFGEGRARNELTSWTKVSPSTVTVAPGGTATATVEVTVPRNVSDGERYAVVWAELPSSGGEARVINRVGIRLYISIGEGDEPDSDFRIETLTAAREKDGTPVVRTTIVNTGGRALDISGKMTLSDGPGGLRAGPFNVEVGTTLGLRERAPATVHLNKDLPNGPWKAVVTIQSGELRKTARATITFPSEAGASSRPVVAESVRRQRRILIPLAFALVLALLIALLLLALRGRRKEREPST